MGESSDKSGKAFTPVSGDEDYHKAKNQTILMFVDLVGSTAYWFKHPNMSAFRIVKKFHDAVLNIASSQGGRPIKGIGDEVMLRFDANPVQTACADAIEAAFKMQNSLKNNPDLKNAETEQGLLCKIIIHRVKDAVRVCYHEAASQETTPKFVALKKATAAGRNETIIPEKYSRDIVGHHVNLAARVGKIVRSDQVLISEEALKCISPSSLKRLKTRLHFECSGLLTVHGFRGIGKGVAIRCLGSRNQIKRPDYPMKGIVMVTMESGEHYNFAERLKEYSKKLEAHDRIYWGVGLRPVVGHTLGDRLAFKVGAIDADDFETFVENTFYSDGTSKLPQTETAFLRQVSDMNHKCLLIALGKSSYKYRELWMVKLALGKRASLSTFESWLRQRLRAKNAVKIIDYERTWGNFEACLLIGSSQRDALKRLWDMTERKRSFFSLDADKTQRYEVKDFIAPGKERVGGSSK